MNKWPKLAELRDLNHEVASREIENGEGDLPTWRSVADSSALAHLYEAFVGRDISGQSRGITCNLGSNS
jgi:hypothetical protein